MREKQEDCEMYALFDRVRANAGKRKCARHPEAMQRPDLKNEVRVTARVGLWKEYTRS